MLKVLSKTKLRFKCLKYILSKTKLRFKFFTYTLK